MTLRVACLFFTGDARSEILRIAEACLRWTPQIAVSDEAVFLEIGRCRGLYQESSLALRLRALAKRFECDFQLAFADDVPRALALARMMKPILSPAIGGKSVPDYEKLSDVWLPIEALVDYANPFGADPETVKLSSEMARILRKLGIATLPEFLRLSERSLPSRFGKLGLLLHQRIREAASIPWPRFMPPSRILERAQCGSDDLFYDLEPLVFMLKPVIDRAMARLKGRGDRAVCVRTRLQLEKYSTVPKDEASRSWKFDLALPQGSSVGLIPILRERLGFDLGQKPLASPVTDLEFEILETAPGMGSQRDFFDAREEEVEAWNSIISRLVEKLGDGKVYLAEPIERYSPEKNWVKRSELSIEAVAQDLEKRDGSIEREFPEVRGNVAERPLRILPKPVPLTPVVMTSRVVTLARGQGDAPRAFRLEDRVWQVMGVEGPEILSGEWWFRDSQRSYFKLATDTGENLWVYQTTGSETLYLHGYFD